MLKMSGPVKPMPCCKQQKLLNWLDTPELSDNLHGKALTQTDQTHTEVASALRGKEFLGIAILPPGLMQALHEAFILQTQSSFRQWSSFWLDIYTEAFIPGKQECMVGSLARLEQ